MQRKYVVWSGGRRLEFVASGHRVMDVDNEDTHVVVVGNEPDLQAALHGIGMSSTSNVVLHSPSLDELWTWYRSRFTFVQAAGGAVTDENGRLLVMHRRNMWDLPKGKVDEGEGIPVAAVREVMEECGTKAVHIDPLFNATGQGLLCSTWHTYDHKGQHFLKRTDWFLMRSISTEQLIAQVEEDITEVRWMTLAELDTHREGFYPTLHEVIDAWRGAH